MSTLQYAPGEVPPFAFCESIHAGGRSPWHVRRITPGVGLMLGGGIDTPSLCGRVRRGWDLRVRITPSHFAVPNLACPDCAAEYRRITSAP